MRMTRKMLQYICLHWSSLKPSPRSLCRTSLSGGRDKLQRSNKTNKNKFQKSSSFILQTFVQAVLFLSSVLPYFIKPLTVLYVWPLRCLMSFISLYIWGQILDVALILTWTYLWCTFHAYYFLWIFFLNSSKKEVGSECAFNCSRAAMP